MPETQKPVDRELLLEFFLKFSRFEYALKASNFYIKNDPTRYDARKPPDASPDWDSFAVSLRDSFVINERNDLREACEFILDSPPNKQVLIKNPDDSWTISWETPVRQANVSDVEFILRMIRCVRNNLFHGGKYNIAIHEMTDRTERLLKSSLIILDQCLALAPNVKWAFDRAVL